MTLLELLALFLFGTLVNADVYLQQMRGSNNRLDDENRDRNNANRCFDSQNNNRGGYNVGQIYYYTGSIAYLDWTNQHSCGGPTNHCELILQYACDSLIRDGTTQNTIPIDSASCSNYNCDTDVRFCRHESFSSYQSCSYRSRNKGLFTSNQNLQGNSAIYTRQNPNGGRRGLECPEERDYYPYWYPTIWRDVAIFTNEPSRCAAYKAESENVKGRGYCWTPPGWQTYMAKKYSGGGFIPINQDDCEDPKYVMWTDPATNLTSYGQWRQAPAHNIDPPVCYGNVWTRDNHLGNVNGGFPNGFNWTVPNSVSENCVFRLRYNISTGDFPGFANDTSVQTSYVDFTENSVKWPDDDSDPSNVTIWTDYGFNFNEVQDCFDRTKNNDESKLKNCREYVLKNNPKVDIFGGLLPQTLKLQLAINTAQYGRTFQDRSHKFGIRQAPGELAGKVVHNLQVRGKRGNIVQVFPGTEYDFAPNLLHVKNGDYVHIQWTGSNSNPYNNAGEGRDGTDRHNIVALRPRVYFDGQVQTFPSTYGQWGGSYPARLINDTSVQNMTQWKFLGLSRDDLEKLAILKNMQYGGSMYKLDDAGTYFDLGPKQVTQNGIYHYLCTRNNNFSNRGQKAKIVVSDAGMITGILDSNGGTVSGYNVQVSADAGALSGVTIVTITNTPNNPNSSLSSSNPIVTVSPMNPNLQPGKKLTISIPFTKNPVGGATVYQSASVEGSWQKVDADISGSTATVSTSTGGNFVVYNPNNYGAIFGTLFAILIVAGVIGYFYYRRRKKQQAVTTAAVTQAINKGNESQTPLPIASPTPVTEPTTTQSSVDGRVLPSGWQAVTDPKDGATYYVHPTTGASQWEFPEA